MQGFERELEERLTSITTAKTELERLYAKRVDDAAVESPEQSAFKEQCLASIRAAESVFTSYAGSVRSIKGVIDTYLIYVDL